MKSEEKFKEYLKKRGITQKELSKKLGISEATMSRYIKGQKEVPLNFIFNLAYVLNMPIVNSLDLFMGDTDSKEKYDIILKQYEHQSSISSLNKTIADLTEQLTDIYSQITTLKDYVKEIEVMEEEIEVPIYGTVPAGVPIDAVEDIKGTVKISKDWIRGDKEFMGLEIQGDSMYPMFIEGDTVIIEKTPEFNSGDIAVVYVNGYEATVKKIKRNTDGTVTLIPINPMYPKKTYGPGDEPIKVLGIVRELRRNSF